MIWTDPQLLEQLPVLGWPLVMLAAWLFGEWAHHRLQLPRIACYALVGFVAGSGQLGWLAASAEAPMALLAHIGFGLLLFEFGYRVNLRWYVHNPALLLAGLLDALLSFVAVYLVALGMGSGPNQAALMAALGMAASPAALVRVLQEQRAAGQISERLVHVAALNCLLAVIVFKAVLGVTVFEASGSLAGALYTGAWATLVSAGLGCLAGVLLPRLLRNRDLAGDRSLPYALTLLVLVGASHVLHLSPIVAALVFGIVARHRREVFSRHTRGFGPLGDLLALALFVYLGSRLEWGLALSGLGAGVALVLTRLLVTGAVMTGFSYSSGISWRKGALTGLGLMPLSAFALLLLEQSRHLGVDLLDGLAPLMAALLILELLGPLCTQLALRLGGELPMKKT
jgi:Kef-type K+ transport system membrane component KefB